MAMGECLTGGWLPVDRRSSISGAALDLFDRDIKLGSALSTPLMLPIVPITIATPGQNAAVTFGGTSGQHVTVRVTGNTTGLVTVKLLRPDGTTVTSTFQSSSSFNLSAQTLGVSGTYTISIDPNGVNTGIPNVNVTSP